MKCMSFSIPAKPTGLTCLWMEVILIDTLTQLYDQLLLGSPNTSASLPNLQVTTLSWIGQLGRMESDCLSALSVC